MAFRSILLCLLVSYLAIVTALPVEESPRENDKTEVENVEPVTEEIQLDSEGLSSNDEISDAVSEEHPDSSGLFGYKSKSSRRSSPKKVTRVNSRKPHRNRVIDFGRRTANGIFKGAGRVAEGAAIYAAESLIDVGMQKLASPSTDNYNQAAPSYQQSGRSQVNRDECEEKAHEFCLGLSLSNEASMKCYKKYQDEHC